MFSGLLVFRNRGWENISPKMFAKQCFREECLRKKSFYCYLMCPSSENMARKQYFRFAHFLETNLGKTVSAKVFPILPRA
jgi:hypothetical protein